MPPTTQMPQNQIGRAELAGQESGAGEDPRADHVGDHQRRGADQAQLAEKSGFSGGHYFILRVERSLGLRAVALFVLLAAAAGARIVAADFAGWRRRSLRLFWLLVGCSPRRRTRIEPCQPQALVEREHHQLGFAAGQMRRSRRSCAACRGSGRAWSRPASPERRRTARPRADLPSRPRGRNSWRSCRRGG